MRAHSLLLAVSLAISPLAATAHDVVQGANGGQIAEDAGHHVEFTTKDGQVVLFVTDEADKPHSSAKSAGRVIIQSAAKQTTAELIAAEPNVLTAKLDEPLPIGAKLVVSIKLGDGHDVKARFVAK
jgi:hypothetical protein